MNASAKNIRLRQLRCFLAVAELGSVTRAAAALNTSQPAVSRSLRELEQIVGRPLFARTASGLVLSTAGEEYRRHVAAALAQIETGTQEAQGRSPTPTMTVGVLPNILRGLAPAATARFKALSPQVNVQLRWSHVHLLLQDLRRGEIELILGRLMSMEQMSGLSFEQLFTESLVFVVAPGHPLAQARDVTLSEINGFEVAQPSPGTIIRREMDRFIFARGFSAFARTVETVAFEFTRAYLQLAPVVACLPLSAVRRELASGALVQLPIDGDELVGSVGITTLSGRRLSPAAQRFAEAVRASVAQGEHISVSI